MARALLVDDDAALLAQALKAVQLADLELLTASSWDEGLALFHVLSPDLVIADYNMPGSRHGLQLLAEIRRLRPSVRLILISGYLDEDDAAEVERLGIVDRTLLKEPGTAREIVDEIRSVSATESKRIDWKAYAQAYVETGAIAPGDLEKVDRALSKKVKN